METTAERQDEERRMPLPASTERADDAQARDQWLDQALEETFPASDPIASGFFD
jgi:hypothetical protein